MWNNRWLRNNTSWLKNNTFWLWNNPWLRNNTFWLQNNMFWLWNNLLTSCWPRSSAASTGRVGCGNALERSLEAQCSPRASEGQTNKRVQLRDPLMILSWQLLKCYISCIYIYNIVVSNKITHYPCIANTSRNSMGISLLQYAATACCILLQDSLTLPYLAITCAKPGCKVCRSSDAVDISGHFVFKHLQADGFGQGTASEGATKNKEFLSSAFAPYSLSIPEQGWACQHGWV